jgi:adenine-specific DNA-methyltransferase
MELHWDGKYDEHGKRVAPPRISLPFQTVETVNESAQQRQRMLDLFSSGGESDWRNRLIWGDKRYVLPALLSELSGAIQLVYIDPPFATGDNFSYNAKIPNDDDNPDFSFVKQPSVIEQKAYRDTWGRGLDGYMQWFYETVLLIYDLLDGSGSLYVHCDSRVNSGARIVLERVRQ